MRCIRATTSLPLAMCTTFALAFAMPVSAQLDDFFSDDEEEDDGPFEIAGSVKSYTIVNVPYEHALMPEDPTILGAVAGRLILRIDGGEHIQAEVHPLLIATTAGFGGGSTGGLTQLGVGGARPEMFDLSLDFFNSPTGTASGIIDRAFVRFKIPHFDLTLGRQPVAFGQAFFFTPMDIVSPFSPATVDREYKPGVDAVRGDFYFGTSGRITALAAYQNAWNVNGILFATHARYNLVGIDYGAFAARGNRSTVLGLDVTGDILGVSWRGEATGTFPDYNKPFLRGVFGADFRWDTVSVLGEVYVQTLGEDDPKQYLSQFTTSRFARGELWLVGRYYAAVSGSWTPIPIITTSVSVIANIEDQSAMVSPALSWSVSDEVDVFFGAQISQGERPDDIAPEQLVGPDGAPLPPEAVGALFSPNSEFGLYPSVGFMQLQASF